MKSKAMLAVEGLFEFFRGEHVSAHDDGLFPTIIATAKTCPGVYLVFGTTSDRECKNRPKDRNSEVHLCFSLDEAKWIQDGRYTQKHIHVLATIPFDHESVQPDSEGFVVAVNFSDFQMKFMSDSPELMFIRAFLEKVTEMDWRA